MTAVSIFAVRYSPLFPVRHPRLQAGLTIALAAAIAAPKETKNPQSVILAGRRESSYGYVVTRSVTQPRRKPRYFGGEAPGCVRLRRTRIYPEFARIIPDTRPSGSLRSRKIAPGDFFRFALLFIIPAFGGNDKQERRE